MDNDFLEFYIEKCTSDVQSFLKFLNEKLSSLPKDEPKPETNDLNPNQMREKSIETIEQMRKAVMDYVKEYFDRFLKEAETIFQKDGPNAIGMQDPKKFLQSKIDEMNESLEKLKQKDSPTLKAFLVYDFAKEMAQIENLVNTSLSQPSTNSTPKKFPVRVIANTQALCKLEDALAAVVTMSYSEISPSKSICEITAPNHFLTQLDMRLKNASGLVDDTNCLILYNVVEETIMKIPVPTSNLAINPRVFALPDGMTFFIGGVKNGKPCSDTHLLDVTTLKIIQKANMKFAKIGNAICSAKIHGRDYLFSIGGKGDTKRLDVCERFSVAENKWELMANLKCVRAAATACCFNNQSIYCFGGFNAENKIESCIEKYDILLNVWEEVLLKNPSSFLPTIESSSVQINDNQIIILGGSRSFDGQLEVSKDISLLNVDEGIVTNLGSELANPLNFGNQIIVHEKKLFCFGRLRKESKVFGPSDVIFTMIDGTGCSNGTIIDISGFDYL